MPAKWHKYSYSAQIAERRTVFSVIALVICLAVFFTLIHLYLVTMYHIASPTMEPTISSGDSVITTPLYRYNPDRNPHFSPFVKPERGDLVVIAPRYSAESGKTLQALNALIAFLTFQRIRPFDQKASWGEKPVIRRLIAFPGDSVYMDDFVLHVKTADSAHFLTEFETSTRNYDLKIEKLPENWTKDLPFSASFPEMTLAANEFFVLCDNRMSASDSRVWGPVTADRVSAKVLFRYWPLGRIGPL